MFDFFLLRLQWQDQFSEPTMTGIFMQPSLVLRVVKICPGCAGIGHYSKLFSHGELHNEPETNGEH